MDSVTIINEKLDALRKELEELKMINIVKQQELLKQIEAIKKCYQILENDKEFYEFDFSTLLNLLEAYNYSISDFSTIITDMKNVIKAREDLKFSSSELPFSERQINTYNMFLEKLRSLEVRLLEEIKEIKIPEEKSRKIENIEAIKSILENKGNRKYYTKEMFYDLYSEIPLLEIDLEEALTIIESFYNTRNLSGYSSKNNVPLDKVMDLYKEYLSKDYINSFLKMLQEYEREVTSNIDIENTREILQFFKEENILERFRKTALLKVTLYGKIDDIKKIYEKINKNGEINEAYFEDAYASIWIKNNRNYRPPVFRVREKREGTSIKKSLHNESYTISLEELTENIELLKQNRDLFDEEINLDDTGSDMSIKTIPTWMLKKNIALCRLFKLNSVYKVPITCMKGDFEDKLHLAIELGLLNPLNTSIFESMDSDIVKNQDFQNNMSKKGIYNESIRNYFMRNLSYLHLKSIGEHALLSHKLYTNGYKEFYNIFFSKKKAGTQSSEIFDEKDRRLLSNSEEMEEFLLTNFVSGIEKIEDYAIYDKMIIQYITSLKDHEEEYYIEEILNDELIRNLEENYKASEYIYLFNNRIISRYKVLHYASILKGLYGNLTKEMLLTSIIRNSFITEADYKNIESIIMGRNNNL